MAFKFRPCSVEVDYEAYVTFLLRHYNELRLPYSFSTSLSFISSPLLLGKAMLIWSDEPHEIVGAAGFVYGTGPNDYEDVHVCQVEVVFLLGKHRSSSLFLKGLVALLQEIKQGNPEVKQIQFWTAASSQPYERLFAKFGALPGSKITKVNEHMLYTILFEQLEAYCQQFNRRAIIGQYN